MKQRACLAADPHVATAAANGEQRMLQLKRDLPGRASILGTLKFPVG